jgi:hypothetical protein
VAEGLHDDKIFPYATDVILQYSPVIPPLDEAIHILELLATEVAPALGWRPQTTVVMASSQANERS